MTDREVLIRLKEMIEEHLAPEADEDRPSRRELAFRDEPQMYYPEARVNFQGSMRTLGRYRRGYPEGAVIHFTSGRDDPSGALSTAFSNNFCYFVIGVNGDVYQNFPLSHWGRHAGTSTWPGLGSGVSQYLVGIEICNAGKLTRLSNGRFRPWYNEEDYLRRLRPPRNPNPADDLPESQVRHIEESPIQVEGWYEKFSEMQEAALKTLLRWLKSNNPDVFSYDLVLGHTEVAGKRKEDPGGALSMTMPELRRILNEEA